MARGVRWLPQLLLGALMIGLAARASTDDLLYLTVGMSPAQPTAGKKISFTVTFTRKSSYLETMDYCIVDSKQQTHCGPSKRVPNQYDETIELPDGLPADSYKLQVWVGISVPELGYWEGLETTYDFTVNGAPALACPRSVTVTAAPCEDTAPVEFTIAAAGYPAPTITSSHQSGDRFPVGTTRVRTTASNAVGSDSCEFTVEVQQSVAPCILPPIITCPGTVAAPSIREDDGAGRAYFDVTATGDPMPQLTISARSGDWFVPGYTTVVARAVSATGEARCEFEVYIYSPHGIGPPADEELSTITCPVGVAAKADDGKCTASGVALGTPALTGIYDGQIPTNNAPAAFPVGATTVAWTVADGPAYSGTCTQTVTVTDRQKPRATIAPVTAAADHGTGTATNVRLGTPTVTENCGIRTIANDAPAAFPIGTTAVTWTIVDTSGNRAVLQQAVTVIPNISVTGADLRTFDVEPARPGRQMHLVFLPPTTSPNRRRFDASTPGGLSVNAAVSGVPGTQAPVTLTVTAPFTTVGSTPIRAYSGVTMTQTGADTTYVPGTLVATYPDAIRGRAGGSVTVNVTIPATGFAFVTMQVAHGLAGTNGWMRDGAGSARSVAGGAAFTVWNPDWHLFRALVDGAPHGSETLSSLNAFKTNPGAAGSVRQAFTAGGTAGLRPVAGAKVQIVATSGAVRGAGVTDADGYFAIPYFHGGATAPMDITVTSALGTITRRVTFQRNALTWADFQY